MNLYFENRIGAPRPLLSSQAGTTGMLTSLIRRLQALPLIMTLCFLVSPVIADPTNQTAPPWKGVTAFYYDAAWTLLQIEDTSNADLSSRTLVPLLVNNGTANIPSVVKDNPDPTWPCIAQRPRQWVARNATLAVHYVVNLPVADGTEDAPALAMLVEKLNAPDRVMTCTVKPPDTCTYPPYACHCPKIGNACPAGCCW